jgi:hypothetical protein
MFDRGDLIDYRSPNLGYDKYNVGALYDNNTMIMKVIHATISSLNN